MHIENQKNILFVGRNKASAIAVQTSLSALFRFAYTPSYEQALAFLHKEKSIALIMLEHTEAEDDILAFLAKLKTSCPQKPIIVATPKKHVANTLLKEIVRHAGVAGFIDGLFFDSHTIKKEVYRALNLAPELAEATV